MPDTRTQRGPHPKDLACFAPEAVAALRVAVGELSWLLERGYPARAALKLVGDRHALKDRQRKALQRSAAAPRACRQRRRKRVRPGTLAARRIAVDGYNVLLTVEAALSGGVLLIGRDGAMRDLAAMSGHYRRVAVTRRAIDLLADALAELGSGPVHWYLDRPVSNSGRLRRLIEERVDGREPRWTVELADGIDRLLGVSRSVVATADSAILDRCESWFNLARHVVESAVPQAWIVDLG